MGPRNAVLGGGNRCTGWWRTHAGGANGTLGGAPYGATKRCTGWVKRREQRLYWVVADTCGRCHWGLRAPQWGHEAM
eukprot:9490703-Pyramimonas_sp.AAC.1